jgi:hypothetical protein
LYFDADANYTYEALMNLMGKTSSCTRFYINWRIKFSKNGMDFQGITIPLFKSRPANEDNSIVAKDAMLQILIIMNIKVSLWVSVENY